MRILVAILATLIVLVQYPLWLGKGGWLRVGELDRQVQALRESNKLLEARNQKLDAEVRDLKQGFDAIEERARFELGMVRQDEIFFQVLREAQPATQAPPVPGRKQADSKADAKAEK